MGTTASRIVLSLLILELTKSPAAAGLAAALRAVPYVVLSLPVGALIDRWDRKRVMVLCHVGRAIAVASIPVAMLFHVLTIWQLYAVSLIEGSLFVLFSIAEVAALPRVVDREQLPSAAAANEAAFGAASVVGPSFGTVLYQNFGRGFPFLADALSYVVSIVSLIFIKTEFQAERVSEQRRSLRADVSEGLRWLWRNPLIRYMAFLVGALYMVDAGTPLLIIMLAKVAGVPDGQIGLIVSLGGVGAILGSLVAGQLRKRASFGSVVIGSTWALALLYLAYVFSHGVVWLGIVTVLINIVFPVFNVTQFSHRLALIPDELQGRVNSVFRLIAIGLSSIGAALSGVLIQWIGVTATVVVFGLWLVACGILTWANSDVRRAQAIADM